MHNGIQHVVNLVGIEQPLRTRFGFSYLRHRASHVNVNNIRSGIFLDKLRRLNQGILIAPENLNADRVLVRVNKEHAERLLIPKMDSLIRNHFAFDQPSTEFPTNCPEGHVCHPSHRRNNDLIRNLNVANLPLCHG